MFGAGAENGQHFQRVLTCIFLLFDIGAEGVHQRLNLLGRKISFLKYGSPRLVIVPSALADHVEIYLTTELYSILSLRFCFSVCFVTAFAL